MKAKSILSVLIFSALVNCSPLASFASDDAQPKCSCMAANPNASQKKHKGGPVKHVLKGLGKEFGSDFSDMGKDAILVFSNSDFDPYASKPGRNPKRPYVLGDVEYVDGSKSQIVKFTDRSIRVYGGFVDGTYACPRTPDSAVFDIFYPNGVKGELALSPDGTAVIKRPDGTTTKITKTAAGGYQVNNNKLGYIGDINTDETGLNYEFARSNNPVNNLQ